MIIWYLEVLSSIRLYNYCVLCLECQGHHQSFFAIQKGLPDDLKARERYLIKRRDHLLESKKKAREEELKRYKQTQIPSSSPVSTVSRGRREGGGSIVLEQETAAASKNTRSKSGVLCSVIARKLREEQI